MDRIRIKGGQDGWLKIHHFGAIGDVIAKSVADGFSACPFVHDMTDRFMDFLDRVGTTKNQK